MLRIADLEFAVKSAHLKAYCREDYMNWNVEIECAQHNDGEFHRHEPNLSLSLFETSPNEFRHWTALAPRETDWREKNDTDVTPSGSLYIVEHTPIFECHVRLLQHRGQPRIELVGKCDVHFDERYDMNLDLRLESVVAFRGVWFGRRPEADCRNEVSRFLNPDDFDFAPTEHGVSVLVPK